MSERKAIKAVFLDAAGTVFSSAPETSLGVKLYDDANAILQLFRKRKLADIPIRTALVTNWGRRVHTVVSALGVADCFDVVVCRDDVDRGKPFPDPFLFAANSLGVDPQECLHIGDVLHDDAFGAYEAGLQSLWLNRRLRQVSEEEQRMIDLLAHPVFTNFDEVLAYLQRRISINNG